MAHPADGRGATELMNGGINDTSMRPGGALTQAIITNPNGARGNHDWLDTANAAQPRHIAATSATPMAMTM